MAREIIDLLFTGRVYGKIDEAPLDLRPFVPHLVRKPVSIILESLVQDADDNEPPFAPIGHLCELLKDVNVSTVTSRGLKELTHFIDEEYNSAMILGVISCGLR